jgi:hypothetical protein
MVSRTEGAPETRCDASELDVSGKSHGKGYTGPEGYTGTDMEKETSGEYQASWLLSGTPQRFPSSASAAAAACSNQLVISTTEHLNTAASRSQAMSCSNPLIIHLQAKESFRTDIGKAPGSTQAITWPPPSPRLPPVSDSSCATLASIS